MLLQSYKKSINNLTIIEIVKIEIKRRAAETKETETGTGWFSV